MPSPFYNLFELPGWKLIAVAAAAISRRLPLLGSEFIFPLQKSGLSAGCAASIPFSRAGLMSAGRTLAGFRNAPIYPCMAALSALCGCSGGPSGSDIQTALQEASNALFDQQMATVENISDVDCKEAQGKPGYVCSFAMTFFSELTNARSSQVMEARFVQNASKWIVMNDK